MKLLKRIMKITLLGFICIALFLMIFTGCMNFRRSTKKFNEEFKEFNIKVTVVQDTFENKGIRYLSYIKNNSLPTLIFVHGAPGSSTSFSDYIKDTSLNQHFNIIVVDRLGYGYSNYGKYTSLDQQATWLAKLVKQKSSMSKVFLIGHSFGGPIIARSAVKLGNTLAGGIMIAPALDPENEKYFFGGRLAYWKATRWMFSGAWRVSASEKYRHANELKAIENDWSLIQSPIYHIHGTKDKLVPFSNLAFSSSHFKDTVLQTYSWEEEGHLIPFTKKEKTIKLIISFVNKHI